MQPDEGATNTQKEGWTKAVGYDQLNPLFSLPTETGGSSSTYMCDYSYINYLFCDVCEQKVNVLAQF